MAVFYFAVYDNTIDKLSLNGDPLVNLVIAFFQHFYVNKSQIENMFLCTFKLIDCVSSVKICVSHGNFDDMFNFIK